jgi:hypothetical protein
MPTAQSQFSRLPKKQLVFIAEKLVDEDFPIGNPYEDDFDKATVILETVSKYFSIEVVMEDVEFFAKFLEINDDLIADLFANNKEQMRNKELIEQLVIPSAKTYNLLYDVWGTCNYTEYKQQEFDSYDKNWVKESAHQQMTDGDWSTWDGQDRRESEYDNYEESNWEFNGVYEVEDKPIQETLLSKLVLENTSDVIDSLDRTTLIKLRNLINQKLSS